MSREGATHIVVVGNVTIDRTADGTWRPGGPSLYSSRTALALGAKVTLVSHVTAAFDRSALDGIEVHALPASRDCRYEPAFDAAGNRTLVLLDEGEPISIGDITFPADTDAMLIAPAYHELDTLPACDARVVAVSLQGLLRATRPDGAVIGHPDAECRVARFLRPGILAFFSEEDIAEPEALARFIAAKGGIAVLTRGYRGAKVFTGSSERVLAAVKANVIDPTGAGDCFAAAFVVRYAETGDLEEASRYALAAGSLAVEAPGLAGVPTRAQLEERLRREAA